MSTVATSLISWEEFLALPDAGAGTHYELHDGRVILVSPPRPLHVYIQSLLVQWLTNAAQGKGRAAQEFPYRPAKNLQFWHADVAYILNEHWEAMRRSEYPVYAPPLVIEVLSPSNKEAQVHRQCVAAFSGGTREFWVIDLDGQSIEVSLPGGGQTLCVGRRRLRFRSPGRAFSGKRALRAVNEFRILNRES